MTKKVTLRSRQGDSSSILGDVLASTSSVALRTLKLEQVQPSPLNPRRAFDHTSLQQLAKSIQDDDLLEPLVVREINDGFEIVAGERRYRALKIIGRTEADCKVLSGINDESARTLSLVENLNREDLSPLDELDAVLAVAQIRLQLGGLPEVIGVIKAVRNYERSGTLTKGITEETALTLQTLFHRIGISSISSFVANRLPILLIPQDVLDAVRQNRITMTHARPLAKVHNKEERLKLIDKVANRNISSRELAEIVKNLLDTNDSDYIPEEERIKVVKSRLTAQRLASLNESQRVRANKLLAELEVLLQ